MYRLTPKALGFLAGLSLLGSASGADIFDSDEPVSLVLEAPMRTLVKDMKKKPTVDGVLSYTDAAGQVHSFDVKVNTRGNTRLAFCDFPPLKVDFRKNGRPPANGPERNSRSLN